jgi:hypothetical protein
MLKTMTGWLAQGFTWILDWEAVVFGFTLSGQNPWEMGLKAVFLLLPVGLLVAGVWCTMASLYTLPFAAAFSPRS